MLLKHASEQGRSLARFLMKQQIFSVRDKSHSTARLIDVRHSSPCKAPMLCSGPTSADLLLLRLNHLAWMLKAEPF